MNKCTFFFSWWHDSTQLQFSEHQQYILLVAILQYLESGEQQTFDDREVEIYFTGILPVLKKQRDVAGKRREAGKKGGERGHGGAPAGNQNARQKDPRLQVTRTDTPHYCDF